MDGVKTPPVQCNDGGPRDTCGESDRVLAGGTRDLDFVGVGDREIARFQFGHGTLYLSPGVGLITSGTLSNKDSRIKTVPTPILSKS